MAKTCYFKRISEIPPEFLAREGIKLVLADVDNTLAPDMVPVIPADIVEWLKKMDACGVCVAVLSNGNEGRIRAFAAKYGLKYFAKAKKPSAKKARTALKELCVQKNETLLVGDQIFTDIMCAKALGVRAALVDYFEIEKQPFFKLKRFLERPFANAIRKRGRCV